MRKIVIPVLLVIVSIQIYYFLFRGSVDQKEVELPQQDAKFDGKLLFEFTELEANVLAQSGEHQVLASELESSAAMRAFRNRRKDILFVLVYKQFVIQTKTPAKKIEFSVAKLSRSPGSLLNQYGLPLGNGTELKFDGFSEAEGFAKVDGRIVRQNDLDVNNFIWASYDSDLFRYKLNAVRSRLRQKALSAEAKKVGLTVANYIKKYVHSKLPLEVSEKSLDKYMKKYNMENTPDRRRSAKNQLLSERRERGKNYILERFVMDLPIKINISAPSYVLEEKTEWTPVKSNGSALVEMTLFSDTQMSESVEVLEGLIRTVDKYKGVSLKYRPLFLGNNGAQKMTSQMHFCVLKDSPQAYWKFLSQTLGKLGGNLESVLYEKASQLNLPVEKLKKCLVGQKTAEVVDYHLDYARYLGMSLGPILYVGGEVLHGKIRMEDVESVLNRKLKVPAAGVWKKP